MKLFRGANIFDNSIVVETIVILFEFMEIDEEVTREIITFVDDVAKCFDATSTDFFYFFCFHRNLCIGCGYVTVGFQVSHSISTSANLLLDVASESHPGSFATSVGIRPISE